MRFLALASLLLLSGCTLFSGGGDVSCPRVGFLPEAVNIQFDGARAQIDGFNGTCRARSEGGLRLDLALPFSAVRQEQAVGDVTLPYFIAVLSPDEAVLQRQDFSTTIVFGDTNAGTTQEDLRINLPLPEDANASAYKVIIGFALTPEQLAQNRPKPEAKEKPKAKSKTKNRNKKK